METDTRGYMGGKCKEESTNTRDAAGCVGSLEFEEDKVSGGEDKVAALRLRRVVEGGRGALVLSRAAVGQSQ